MSSSVTVSETKKQSSHWKWWVCGLLLCASTINYMDRMTLASVSRRMIDELHLSKADYGMVEQYFGYAFACGAILFGLIVDKVSVRWLYPTILLMWSLMGILTGYAGDSGWIGSGLAALWSPLKSITGWSEVLGSLLLCRTMLGFFESGHWPCALQTTQRLLDPKDWALGNSVLQSGVSIGAIVTPFIVGAMLTDAPGSWRLPFTVIGLAGMIWVAAWAITIRGRSLGAPALPLKQATPKVPWKVSAGRLLTDHRFWLLAVVVSCINGTWSLYRVWLPLALQDKAGLAFTETQTLGRILPLYYILTDIGCLLAGAATVALHRRGTSVLNSRRWVFTVCSLIVMPAMVLPSLARGELAIPGVPALYATMAVLMMTAAGSLGVFPCYYSFTQELSKEHIGLVTGLLSFVAWVVPSSLQKPLGAHIDKTGSYDLAFQVGAWPMIFAAVMLWLFWDLNWLRGKRAVTV
ncbi:MAG TPA: MFS transporter [Bryobacteraceae bacterium]|nr:MFS transporter [Bryobacteraceae bacterium]